MRNKKSQNYIMLFLILAFGLPLICIILIRSFNVFKLGIFNFTLYGIEAATPSIAALLTIAILDNYIDLKLFLKKCYIHNIKFQYLLIAIIFPLTLITLTKITSLIFVKTSFITAVTSKKLIISLWSLISEEIGWRGFLQEKLSKNYSPLKTSIIVGIVWSLWHYHFFLLGTISAPIILFVIGCMTDSICYYWITVKSKNNIIPASIWHCIENLCFYLFTIAPEYSKGNLEPYSIYIIYSIVMAIIINHKNLHETKLI